MEGPTLLDKNGKSLRNCIIWADNRGDNYCNAIAQKVGEKEIYRITGLRVNPMHTLPKLLWIKKNESRIFNSISSILLPKDYVRYKLTDKIATEHSDASSTLMLNLNTLTWSKEITSRMGIPLNVLPPLTPSHEVVGEVTRDAATATGLRQGTPVACGGADTACSFLGYGITRTHQTGLYQGSSASLYSFSDKFRPDASMMTITRCHVVPNVVMKGGGLSTAGSTLTWLQQILSENNFRTMTRKAARISAGSDGLMFIPYLMGARSPFWQPFLRGGYYGLTPKHTRAHIIRSTLEGVAYGLRDIYETQARADRTNKIFAGGGCFKDSLWARITSAVLGNSLTVVETESPETLGAATLAGYGTGLLEILQPPRAAIRTRRVSCNKWDYSVYGQQYKKYRNIVESIIDSTIG